MSMNNRFPLLFLYTITVILFGCSTWIFRDYYLDDAYIHLRYAANFRYSGTFFYNEGQYGLGGTSSPFWVFILSCIGYFIPLSFWPLMVKLICILAHILAIVSFFYLLYTIGKYHYSKNNGGKTLPVWIVLSIPGLILAVPSTTRWLQDGMETSFAIVCVLGAGFVLEKFINTTEKIQTDTLLSLFYVCLIILPGILRIDLLPISVIVIVVVLIQVLFIKSDIKRKRKLFLYFVLLPIVLLGVWYSVIFLLTGYVVPDTAIAKQGGKLNVLFIYGVLRTMTIVSPMWLVILPLITITTITDFIPRLQRNLRNSSQKQLFDSAIPLFGIFPFISIIIGGSLHNQYIHGARYFMPALLFAWITFFIYLFRKNTPISSLRFTLALSQIILIVGIILTFSHTTFLWKTINRTAIITFDIPDYLERSAILGAFDIGLIGWYTEAKILDFSGLVHGRHSAQITDIQKRACLNVKSMESYPDFLILQEEDNRFLKPTQFPQHEDGKYGDLFAFMCNNNPSAYYIRTNKIVMQFNKISGINSWYLWVNVEILNLIDGNVFQPLTQNGKGL